ncbi:ABC transporter ATP-binding protein [Paenibacillus sp. OAS669]|uniref:ABC transporter ATP-binding protein n=1 Tax=Paenibacillus sp. OAS669 TaxID=2663821 RepID=UPI00178A5273|nr:ABC transporter ATP-binding protein [Paenibacillus sp. OAS669]MBE1445675.1 ABC-type polysaccharide/polyol phosphate transport system ATPase subunit [Paenibacillus sp. OAS669]
MILIDVRNVSKKFVLKKEKNVTLKEKLIYRGRERSEEFWALHDVSCQIEAGKTIGLIGRNGSGKSTLLKLMTRIMYPTNGSIKIQGRVSSLLELGAGFHTDFTGIENIYMNASILGLTKKEIDQKLQSIIEFSELEEFINNPLRSYSSGMYMRLAFSVAINVNPDILLIDEVLSVGDTSFQKKCINKLKELKRQGKTIVIVSHDNHTMEILCDEVIWLNKGKIVKSGDSKIVINEYLDFMAEEDGTRLNNQKQKQQIDESEGSTENQILNEEESNRWGNREIELTGLKLFNDKDQETYSFTSGEKVRLEIKYVMHKKNEDVVFGIAINTIDGIKCYGTNTDIDNIKVENLSSKGTVYIDVDSLSLIEGTYLIDIAVHKLDGTAYDYQVGKYTFQVKSNIHDVGICKLKHQWIIQ